MNTQTITSSLNGTRLIFEVRGKTPKHHSDVAVEATIPVPAALQFTKNVQMPGNLCAKLTRDTDPSHPHPLPVSASPIDEYGFLILEQIPNEPTDDGTFDSGDIGEALTDGGDESFVDGASEPIEDGVGAALDLVLGSFSDSAPRLAAMWGGKPALHGVGKCTGSCSPAFMTTATHVGPVVMRMGWLVSPDTEFRFWGYVELPLAPDQPLDEAETVPPTKSSPRTEEPIVRSRSEGFKGHTASQPGSHARGKARG